MGSDHHEDTHDRVPQAIAPFLSISSWDPDEGPPDLSIDVLLDGVRRAAEGQLSLTPDAAESTPPSTE